MVPDGCRRLRMGCVCAGPLRAGNQFPLAHLSATFLARNTDMLNAFAAVINNKSAMESLCVASVLEQFLLWPFVALWIARPQIVVEK